jgi:hypothetical protein
MTEFEEHLAKTLRIKPPPMIIKALKDRENSEVFPPVKPEPKLKKKETEPKTQRAGSKQG